MATVQAPTAQRLVLDNVNWRTYTRLLYTFAGRRRLRLTYDRGTLEIMSPLLEHDWDGDFLGALVRALTEELGQPLKAGGSVTLRRRRTQRGLEPDRCYWVSSESQVRGKRTLDLRIDPPPDLAIEIDVTSSSLDRMKIYAALGVPEVWRLDGPVLSFHILGPASASAPAAQSKAFPGLKPADLLRFMGLRGTLDETTVTRQFRGWVQQRISAGWQ